MRGQPGFFDVDERLKRLSDLGDELEAFAGTVDFEMFRPTLMVALDYSDGAEGGRPPFDPVMMFKILVVQALDNLSDERAEFLINDRLSFMRFLGLGLADRVPDARTIWLFRERLIKAKAIEPLFARFDPALRAAGYIAMSGQIVDASLVAAPKQRNSEDEKQAIKAGRIPEEWKDKPAKLRQKDRDARWTVKFTKAKAKEGRIDAARAISRSRSSVIRTMSRSIAVSASSANGPRPTPRPMTDARLREGLLDKTNTAVGVWADTAYRSQTNETFMERNGFVSHVHRKKPKGKPMPEAVRRANAEKSKVRSRVEHVFAEQKDRMDLFIRTIGIARATIKIGMANLVYNFKRLIFLQRTAVA